MFRNYFAAALNNLSRNRLYAAISILGLAVGMAAAILTGLYIRDELSFDHFIPGHGGVYVAVSDAQIAGHPHLTVMGTPVQAADWIRQELPGVSVAARLFSGQADLRHGQVEAVDPVAWVDPGFFRTLPLPAIAGDPDAALRQPDGVVLTRSMARKYFGKDAPLGEVIERRRTQALRVRAVIEDLPHNTHLAQQIFVSNLAANSPARTLGAKPYPRGNYVLAGYTYVRFRSAKDAEAATAAIGGLVRRNMMTPAGGWLIANFSAGMGLIPLDAVHLYPFGGVNNVGPRTDPALLWGLGAVGVLILAMAAINFVNLATARAGRRAVEVGVRKAAGAGRRDLVLQFVGEAVLYALVALVCASAVVELALPGLNARLERGLAFQPWRDPGLAAALIGLALLLGLAAGLYPAFVLSGFRPAAALKGGGGGGTSGAAIRNGLVVAQFAGLIGLVLATAVMGLQTRYTLNDRLRVATGQVVLMSLAGAPGGPSPHYCRDALAAEIRALPGVQEAVCSSMNALDQGLRTRPYDVPRGGEVILTLAPVDAGFFEFYGVRPLAGRLLGAAAADAAPDAAHLPTRVVINEKAAHVAGFASAAAAVGARLVTDSDPGAGAGQPRGISTIVGVIPDFALDVLHGDAQPIIYYEDLAATDALSIKLTGRDVRGTLAAIDALWKRLGPPQAVQRRFLSEQLDTLYRGVIRQELLVAVLAAVAIVIACLGLFGMAAFTAERRTKEIGVRKVMGASRGDIVRLLLWQFTTPVLWASLIALPVAWWAMERWLKGFAARIDLQPWLFLAAPAAAMLIAWATVLAHTLKVAAEKPAGALRYE